jgi:hypothetical protein
VQQVVTSEHISAVFGIDVKVSFDGSRFFARAAS